MASIEKIKPDENQYALGTETRIFLKKKNSAFFPEFLISEIITFVVVCITKNYSFQQSFELLRKFSFEFGLIRTFGFGTSNLNSTLWYLATLVICLAILYPLIRKYTDMMMKVILPLVVLFILGYLFQNKGHLRGPFGYINFTYKGNLRGLAEIGLGVLIYPMVQRFSKFKLTTLSRSMITIIKWWCYISCINYMRLDSWDWHDFYYLFVLALAIMLSFSRQGIDADWFNARIFRWAGKLSLLLYVSHGCIAKKLLMIYPDTFNNVQKGAMYLALSLASAVVIMVLADGYRKYNRHIKNGIARVLIQQN